MGTCGSCLGAGKVTCSACGGTGRVSRYASDGVEVTSCAVCYGSGRMRCDFCNGSGQVGSGVTNSEMRRVGISSFGAMGKLAVGEMSAMAILSVVTMFFMPPLGLIFGIIALVNISRSQGKLRGRGVAIAGVVISALLTLFYLLILIFVIGFSSNIGY